MHIAHAWQARAPAPVGRPLTSISQLTRFNFVKPYLQRRCAERIRGVAFRASLLILATAAVDNLQSQSRSNHRLRDAVRTKVRQEADNSTAHFARGPARRLVYLQRREVCTLCRRRRRRGDDLRSEEWSAKKAECKGLESSPYYTEEVQRLWPSIYRLEHIVYIKAY